MKKVDVKKYNWREDRLFEQWYTYEKKFAFFPVITDSGQKLLFKFYYRKFLNCVVDKHSPRYFENSHTNIVLVGILSEEDYIITKLSETI